MAVSVEEVSSSLVREYLSRKGLKRTIACMDEEHPRTEASINNRSHLMQILNIEGLYRKNKMQYSPLKTLLEIIVKHHIKDLDNGQITSSESDSLQSIGSSVNSPAAPPTVMNDTEAEDSATAFLSSKKIKSRSDVEEIWPSQHIHTSLPETDRLSSQNQSGFWAYDSEEQKGQPLVASLQDNEGCVRREPEKKTESTQRSRSNRIRRGMMAGPIASTPQESNKKRHNRRQEALQPLLRKEDEKRQLTDGLLVTGLHQKSLKSSLTEISSAKCSVGGQQALRSAPERMQRENTFEKVGHDVLKTKKVKSLPRSNVGDLDVSEMVLDDIDDDDDFRELSKASFQRTIAEHSYAGRPMDQHTAVELKMILLGSSLNCFSVEWRNQSFTFSETHDLRYGIVQKKGGPCGVLASIQSFVLKKLLFENIQSSDTGLQRLRPSNTARRKCLVLAASEILWRAGEEKQATVAINSGRNHFTPTGHYKSEGVLEKITCFTVDNIKDLQLILEQHIEQFETEELGCMLLTISAVLSRSVEKVREDMDVPTNTLIGAHGYCTQELVNLLLCGRAVSNVFDNDMELDSGNGNLTLLKGIKGHCDIGLLSLFEHYNICKVGAYLKTPRYPIWVVCSESHFSVLFGLQRELLTNQDSCLEFDLYYYDGLANQQEEICLTVSVGKSALSCQDIDTDLIPPLEHCIRTRWKDALVNWNETEPIL
ncbi:probable ubiquitin carboxyl-terminal hydrolase MINDY-4 isoform X1 [Micropterus salmoides]|uniref:probable ubiquitin carboxyl-terminal hydrolase MINDY-4 isoform X1 n=1 Tax=Micropterus salmoides TaxID=27706 RepID=UPI0018EB2525|nr:probable ubiquitin carboxyl-terminal hydrolase MINDY-4 isoform X1 [Micropterus salmoides]